MQNWVRAAVLPGAIAAALGFSSQVGALGVVPADRAALTRGVNAPETGIERADGRFASNGAAISLYRPAYTAQVAAPEAMAREFLASRATQLGLAGTRVNTLERTSLRQGRHFSVVRFRQTAGGLPVHGSDIAVTVKPNGQVIHVANSTVRGVVALSGPEAKRAMATVSIDADAAVAIARQYLGLASLRLQKTRQMLFVADDGSNHVVWQVQAIGKEQFTGDWELLVDARSGEVLLARDVAAYADGTGQVHSPDPLSYARATYGDSGYVDGNNADTPELTAALVDVTLPGISQTGANYVLSGPYMVCANIEPPNDGACPSQPGTDFSVPRSAMTFDAVMAYYHISTYLKYVNETLGVAAMPLNHPGGVRVDPHGVNGDDNSRYSSSGEDLSFGEGGVDDAQDADVLIHELGHGMHDWVTGGNLSQNEGLSEGTGDYVAGAYGRDMPNQWTPADPAYHWVYSWDGHNPFWGGRVLNYQLIRTYAQARTEAIHSAGQYWASCNLEARKNIQVLDPVNGGQVFDKAFFEGLSTTGGGTNQKDAAQAVIDAAAALGYTQAQIDALALAYNSGNQGGNTGCSYGVTPPIVTDDPVVVVDPLTLAATAEVGASVDSALTLGNAGGADLIWTIDASADAGCVVAAPVDWLAAAPVGGTVAQGAPDTEIMVTLDAANLAVGSHTHYLCVHSNDPVTSVVAVPVTFTVEAQGDTIFADGFDGEQGNPDIVDSGVLDLPVAPDTNGLYLNWLSGATCSTASGGGCDDVAGAYDFNAWGSGTLGFFWGSSIADTSYCVANGGGSCEILDSGVEIGPTSTFGSGNASLYVTDGEKYLGFSFLNADTSEVNYGYAKVSTTAPSGVPMTLHQYWYNNAGDPIVIP